MAIYPWRFQCDLQPDEVDPDVTVFIGDTITNDTTGEKTLYRGTSDPEIVKLSQLPSYIATGMADGVTRTVKAPPPGAPGAATTTTTKEKKK